MISPRRSTISRAICRARRTANSRSSSARWMRRAAHDRAAAMSDAGAAGQAGRLRHDQRQEQSRTDRLREGLSRGLRHRRRRSFPIRMAPRRTSSPPSAMRQIAGIILSGHTDVVPAKAEEWESDPFTLTRRDSRLYGRGTADMKGFVAVVLAAVPAFLARAESPADPYRALLRRGGGLRRRQAHDSAYHAKSLRCPSPWWWANRP